MTTTEVAVVSAYALALPVAYAIGKRSLGGGAVDAIDAASALVGIFAGVAAAPLLGAPVALVAMCAIACAVSDVRFGYIFDAVLIATAGALALACVATGNVLAFATAGILCVSLMGIVAVVFRGSIGFGDVKYAIILGGLGTASGLEAIAFAFVCGGFVAALLLVIGRVRRRTPLPFAPFLAAGVFASVIAGRTWQL